MKSRPALLRLLITHAIAYEYDIGYSIAIRQISLCHSMWLVQVVETCHRNKQFFLKSTTQYSRDSTYCEVLAASMFRSMYTNMSDFRQRAVLKTFQNKHETRLLVLQVVFPNFQRGPVG